MASACASTVRSSISHLLSQAARAPLLRASSPCESLLVQCGNLTVWDGGSKIVTDAGEPIAVALQCTCSTSRAVRGSINASSLRLQSTSASPASASTSAASIPPPSVTTTSSTSTSNRDPASQSPHQKQASYDTKSAIALLRSQPSHYIIASIYQRRFLLTPRDVVTVPRMKDVKVGDVIRLEKIHEVGSRDYTLRSSEGEFLKPEAVYVQATVIEHTKGQMERIVKFKRRKGYQKTIEHKARYTRLRVGEIVLGKGL